MNQAEFIHSIASALINQSLINQSYSQKTLPDDQKKEQENMLKALHDLIEAASKIEPQYQLQVRDTCILKVASEMGWINNPNGGLK